MDIKDILSETDLAKKVSLLKKGRLTELPDIACIEKEWDPLKHKIFDPAYRLDKKVYYDLRDETTGTPNGKTGTRIEKVARIGIAMQKLIVKRAVSFLFGNPVKIICSDEESQTLVAVKRILKDAKQDSLNRKVARINSSCKEVAECWFVVETDEFNTYGFSTKSKVKVAVFNPLKGDKLYPFFDDNGDLVAFSREYKIKEDDKEVTFFETWTKDVYTKYKQNGNSWENGLEEGDQIKLTIGKIPIVYGNQEETEWHDVQSLIDRLEKLLSNFADTVDYHGSPKIAVQGEVKGFSAKGEAGGILELSEGAKAEYLSWAQAPESVKIEIESLLRQIYTLTQTPDISFEGVRALGNSISGRALRMMFLDAHLKVMEKREIYDSYLERRLNILKAFVGSINKELKTDADKIELEAEIIPYMVDDTKDIIDDLVAAVTGGIMSKESAVKLNPLVDDPEGEMTLLNGEAEKALENSNSPDELDNQQNEE